MKKQTGITLITLVITIVVLIILAGVAISLSLGENGIFNKAKEAKRMQLEAEYKEKIGTELLAAQIDAIARNEEPEDEQIKDIISNYGELQEDGDTIKIKDSDIEVSLSDIYKGTTTSSGSYTENKAKIAILEKRVKELQEQLDSLFLSGDEKDKKIAELNKKITELESNIKTLEEEKINLTKDNINKDNTIESLNEEIDSLQKQVKQGLAPTCYTWGANTSSAIITCPPGKYRCIYSIYNKSIASTMPYCYVYINGKNKISCKNVILDVNAGSVDYSMAMGTSDFTISEESTLQVRIGEQIYPVTAMAAIYRIE